MNQKISITNSKIAGLDPTWAPYRGFSLLFDNPGESFSPDGTGLLRIDNKPGDHLELYQSLAAFSQQIQSSIPKETYCFCPLPYHSYHVTVWDGISAGKAVNFSDTQRTNLDSLLADLPDLLGTDNPCTGAAKASRLVTTKWQIELMVKSIAKWGNVSLVALLEPKDQKSQFTFEAIVRQRVLLNLTYRKTFNLTLRDSYYPHVTLGYFANHDLAEAATPLVDSWQHMVLDATNGISIQFNTISLYGFVDMVTFLKKPLPRNQLGMK